MNIRHYSIIMVLIILCQACVTKELWKKTDPDEYVQISMKVISENEIKQKGIKYYRDDKNEVFYLEKTATRKLSDYSLRLFLTPVTVTLDAVGGAIIIVGLLALSQYKPITKEECERSLKCGGSI